MVDYVLGPLAVLPPYLSITIVSLMITCLILGVNKFFFRKNVLKDLKDKMEVVRENLMNAQKTGNKSEIDKFLNEMMKINRQFFKHTIKTLVISLIIVSLIIPWLQLKYEKVAYVVILPFNLPFIGSTLNWLYWYFFISLVVGWVLNRLLS
jgi:uncharacterized membrane protein (DUF106 family)